MFFEMIANNSCEMKRAMQTSKVEVNDSMLLGEWDSVVGGKCNNGENLKILTSRTVQKKIVGKTNRLFFFLLLKLCSFKLCINYAVSSLIQFLKIFILPEFIVKRILGPKLGIGTLSTAFWISIKKKSYIPLRMF